jgi:hypothetical protein
MKRFVVVLCTGSCDPGIQLEAGCITAGQSLADAKRRSPMAVLARMADLARQTRQLLVVTHSPILLSLPGATILEIQEDGDITSVTYDEAMPVGLTRDFLSDPGRYLRHLIPADK